jgi:hypothetical protein
LTSNHRDLTTWYIDNYDKRGVSRLEVKDQGRTVSGHQNFCWQNTYRAIGVRVIKPGTHPCHVMCWTPFGLQGQMLEFKVVDIDRIIGTNPPNNMFLFIKIDDRIMCNVGGVSLISIC